MKCRSGKVNCDADALSCRATSLEEEVKESLKRTTQSTSIEMFDRRLLTRLNSEEKVDFRCGR